MFDDGGQTLDPVAVVAVEDAVDRPDLGVVDVSANHPVDSPSSGLSRHRRLEVAHVADGAFDLQFQESRQAPVWQTQARPQVIEVAIDLEGPLIAHVAKDRQPTGALDHAVEQIAMGHPESAPRGGDMRAVRDNLDTAEIVLDIAAGKLVVIARHEDHPRALASLAQQLLQDVVV
jgi:hypothetical protein